MRSDRDEGFTLLELMMVVLIIAILLAIAIPSYLGARRRANDRVAQSNVRLAHENTLVFYADGSGFTDDPIVMRDLDPALSYTNDLALAQQNTIFIDSPTTDVVFVAARSTNGSCFWIRMIGGSSAPRFAENDCLVIPDPSVFAERW